MKRTKVRLVCGVSALALLTALLCRSLWQMRGVRLHRELISAIAAEDLPAVRSLLAAGADPNARPIYTSTRSRIAGFLQTLPFRRSPSRGPMERPPLLFLEEPGDDARGSRPAVIDAIAEELLNHGAWPNVVSDSPERRGPPHYAAILGLHRTIRALAAMATDLDSRDAGGRTALMFTDALDTAALLSGGANPGARDKDGRTPVFYACREDDVEKIRLLVGAGADVRSRDIHGNTVLFDLPDPRLVPMLVKYGADVNAMNNDRKTPLDYESGPNENETTVGRMLRRHGAHK